MWLRRGEVLGLHWSDIDTANNTITIHRSIASDTSIQTPKTQKAQRTIAVDAQTIKILLTYKSMILLSSRMLLGLILPLQLFL